MEKRFFVGKMPVFCVFGAGDLLCNGGLRVLGGKFVFFHFGKFCGVFLETFFAAAGSGCKTSRKRQIL